MRLQRLANPWLALNGAKWSQRRLTLHSNTGLYPLVTSTICKHCSSGAGQGFCRRHVLVLMSLALGDIEAKPKPRQ